MIHFLLITLLLAAHPDKEGQDPALHERAAFRRPVSLLLDSSERWLLAGNERSGSLSLIDTASGHVVRELGMGGRPSGMALVAEGGNRLLVLDQQGHQLLVFSEPDEQARMEVLEAVAVSSFPVSVRVAPGGRAAYVAGLWSKRLDIVDLSPGSARLAYSLPLPFPPREQVLLPSADRLIVADSFGGRLAVVDLAGRRVERVQELPVHNIRGLAVSPDGADLLMVHQRIDPYARASREDIVWGALMTNTLTSMPLSHLLAGSRELAYHTRTLPLGEPSGDPEELLLNESGEVAVALGGVGRVEIGRNHWPRLDQVRVGRRPTALAWARSGMLFAANTLSDTVSVIDSRKRRLVSEVALGPQPPLTAAERGEALFFDATLSPRGWMSCHSCHTDGHTNGLPADTLGDEDYGAPKRVLSLLGVSDTAPWAWNGGMASLADQIRKSLHTTMNARDTSEEQIQALEAFVRRLELPRLPSGPDSEAVQRGRAVFEREKCHRCHAPPTYTSKGTRDVGMSDAVGNRRFNPPSLRGVVYRSSFFHDARALGLREVFEAHRHPGGQIPAAELDDLIAFLSTL